MNEAEIDALMAGQEDENGCVNYEGKPPLSQFPVFNGTFSSSLSSLSRLPAAAFVKHIMSV